LTGHSRFRGNASQPVCVGLGGSIALGLLSLYWLKHTPFPFLWIGVSFGLFYLFLAYLIDTQWYKIILWNLSFISLILTVFECACIYQALHAAVPAAKMDDHAPHIRASGSYTGPDSYFQDDRLLGYRPKPNVSVQSKHVLGDETIYDVTYTIGPNRLRIETPRVFEGSTPCVLFFGDSFMFGEGLNNNQTIPWQFEEKAAGRYKAFNFGFHGYGPQQMLLWLDGNHEREIVGLHHPVAAVYLAIEDHVNRAGGHAGWDFMGARYALRNNQLVRLHKPSIGYWMAKIDRRLDKSYLLSRLKPLWKQGGTINPVADMDLFIAMVARSRDLFEGRYHGQFIVILWWEKTMADYPVVTSRLAQAGIRTIAIDQIIPDIWNRLAEYTIPHDGHPSAEANRMIADYLVRHIMKGRRI